MIDRRILVVVSALAMLMLTRAATVLSQAIQLADRPTVLADCTSDRAPLEKAIGRIWEEPLSGSYLLDATIQVSQGFKNREGQARR